LPAPRLVIALEGERDAMCLRAEAADPRPGGAAGAALQAATKLRGRVEYPAARQPAE
jgi:hypothetical protein